MSRIFAAVAVGSVLLTGAAAIGIAEDNSGSDSAQLAEIEQVFATFIDVGVLVPLLVTIALALFAIGVFTR